MSNTDIFDRTVSPQRLQREGDQLRALCCPWGWLDVQVAVRCFLEIGLTADDLFEQIEEFAEQCDTKLGDIDPAPILPMTQFYNWLGQKSSSNQTMTLPMIAAISAEIYTAGNYCATSYDWSQQAIDELTGKLQTLDRNQKNELLSDEPTAWFLEQLEIRLS
jgi:hypothetical protein